MESPELGNWIRVGALPRFRKLQAVFSSSIPKGARARLFYVDSWRTESKDAKKYAVLGTSSGFDDQSSSSTSTSTPEELVEDLVDPRDALFASRREQRYFDDPAMTKPVLERSNTGMGYLVLNHDSTANYATSVGSTSSSASSSWSSSSSSSSKNAVDGHGLYSVTDGPTSTTPSAGLDLPGTNLLIRKLRDLEVNSTKRFVVLTHNMDDTFEARERRKALGEDPEAGFVLDGISERDYLLLMAAEKKVYVDVGDSCNREPGRSWSTSRSPGGSATSGAASPTSSSALARRRAARMQSLMGAVEREREVLSVAPAPGIGGHVEGLRASTTRVFDAFLQHFQELALLLADYRKPVLTLFPGHVRQEAVALLGFSEMSAACASTKVFLPDMRKRGILGGTSLLLSQNPIARFCALSRVPLAGADVVYGGIAQHYVSPDALEFLQLSAEKISFSVTEKDGRTLLKEHFLGLPDPSPWFLRRARLVQGLFNGAGRSRFLPEKLGDQTQHSQALAKALFVGAGAGGKTSGSARTAPASKSNVEVLELEKTRGAALGGSEEDHTVAHHFVWSDYVNTWDRNGARLLQQLSSQQATEADIDDARSFLDACLRFLRSEMPVTPIFALNWLLLERAHQIRDAVAVEAGDGQGGPGPGGGNGAGGSSGGGRTVNPVTDKEGHLHRARIVDALALPEVLAWELCAQRLVRSGKMDALITKSAAASRKQKRKQRPLQEQEQCGEGSESLDQHGEATDTDRTHLAAADTVFREVRRLLDSEAAGLPQHLVPSSGSCSSVPRVVESITDRLERTFERTEFALSAVPWVRRDAMPTDPVRSFGSRGSLLLDGTTPLAADGHEGTSSQEGHLLLQNASAGHNSLSSSSTKRVATLEADGGGGEGTDDDTASQEADLSFALSDFDLGTTLGIGAFGRVYFALEKQTNRRVALKSLKKAKLVRQNQAKQAWCERNLLARLQHPFLVNLFGVFQTARNVFFVLEFVRGGEFFFHLRQRDRLPVAVTRFYAACIVLAFEYLHGRRIVYRDLKPENVLLAHDGYLKLADFGAAKERAPLLLRTKSFVGTPEYIAPEILLNTGHDCRVDWWCLGVFLFEMLTGNAPFQEEEDPQNEGPQPERIIPPSTSAPPRSNSTSASAEKQLLLGGKMDNSSCYRQQPYPINIYQRLLGRERIRFPAYLQDEKAARDVIRHLLVADLDRRWTHVELLNSGKCEFFKKPLMDFEKLLRKELEPPFCPTLKSEDDTSNFEYYSDSSDDECMDAELAAAVTTAFQDW
eukprot:g539.t1